MKDVNLCIVIDSCERKKNKVSQEKNKAFVRFVSLWQSFKRVAFRNSLLSLSQSPFLSVLTVLVKLATNEMGNVLKRRATKQKRMAMTMNVGDQLLKRPVKIPFADSLVSCKAHISNGTTEGVTGVVGECRLTHSHEQEHERLRHVCHGVKNDIGRVLQQPNTKVQGQSSREHTHRHETIRARDPKCEQRENGRGAATSTFRHHIDLTCTLDTSDRL